VSRFSEERAPNELYWTVFRHSNDAILVLDVDNDSFIECNPAATELLGYSREELLSLSPRDLHPNDLERFEQFAESVLAEGHGWTDQMVCHAKNGQTVETQVSAGVCRLEEGTCLIAALRDVSELKNRERELERENRRLEDVNSVVSHDLRNPLNVAMGRLDLAMEECDSAHLETAESALQRSVDIIDSVSTLVKGESSVREDDLEPVSLEAMASSCWQNVRTGSVDVRVDGDVEFRADPERLRHLFENLFRNAVEHGSTSPGSHAHQDAVEHGSTSPGSHAHQDAVEHAGSHTVVRVGPEKNGFYVEDDGPGIPEDERADVFEAGFSTDDTGTGLGLNIVNHVVRAHGWTIEVTDGRDGGARFEIRGLSNAATR
jgi:PAS domain S-box-containing protein